MTEQSVIWTVGIQCASEVEDKFNTWYDDVHVPMLLKGGLVRKVSRFKLSDETYPVGTTTLVCPNYLTIYEFDSPSRFEAWMNSPARKEAGDDKTATWGDKVYEVKWASRYNLINAWNTP